MANRWDRLASDAAYAEREVRAFAADQVLDVWVGAAADVFRAALDDFPSQLDKCADSYSQAAEALTVWASDLDTAQDMADRALAQGRAARDELASVTAVLASATAASDTASAALSTMTEVPGPDPDQVAAATARAQAAATYRTQVASRAADTQADLEAAKRLADQARSLREDRERVATSRIEAASDAGIPPNSFWENLGNAVSAIWSGLVTVAKITVAVLGIVVLIIGGPLAWVVLGAALVLLAEALRKFASGQCGWTEVAFAALGAIPGFRGITTLSAVRSAHQAGGVLRAGTHILGAGRTAVVDMARTVRAGASGLRTVVRNLTDGSIIRADRLFRTGPGVRTLSDADNALVETFAAHARAAEPSTTSAMQRVQDSVDGAHLQGLDYRLKTPESLKRKIATRLATRESMAADEALQSTNDSIRYTLQIPDDGYSAGVRAAADQLTDAGFVRVGQPNNTWGGDGYHGINSTWQDPGSGMRFEVQFHTPTSFEAKTSTHALYEHQRLIPDNAGWWSSRVRGRLEANQNETFGAVTIPPGADQITF